MSSSPSTEALVAPFICDCDVLSRTACKGLPFFKEHEGKQYCVLHHPARDKGLAFDVALRSKLEALDFNFRGVHFPGGVDLRGITFLKPVCFASAVFNAQADFGSCVFSQEVDFSLASFAMVDFISARFEKKADFTSAKFGAKALFTYSMFKAFASFHLATYDAATSFSYATFDEETYFSSTTFDAAVNFEGAIFGATLYFMDAEFGAAAYFTSATFGPVTHFPAAKFNAAVDFKHAKFGAEVSFASATFKDHTRFGGSMGNKVFDSTSSFKLQFATIEKPDRISFHTLRLRPYWLVNVDARKFEFVNVDWNWQDISTRQEIESIGEKDVLSSHRLLAIACRNLAVNAEENQRYDEASRFRGMAMEAWRLEGWQEWRNFASWALHRLYWLASGYGERVGQAFLILLGVWLMAAVLYTQVWFVRWEPMVSGEQEAAEAGRGEVGQPLSWPRALTYSLGVMTLQKPEPKPATSWAQAVVLVETILGPVQAALLALAIRRKFMR